MSTPADALLRKLDGEPENAALRAETARALSSEARHAEAHGVLCARLRNLVAHDTGSAQGYPGSPCLCKNCIDPSLGAVTAGGVALWRDFVTSSGRVLFFWQPESLRGEEDAVRAAVAKQLDARLAKKAAAPPSEGADDDDDDAVEDDDA